MYIGIVVLLTVQYLKFVIGLCFTLLTTCIGINFAECLMIVSLFLYQTKDLNMDFSSNCTCHFRLIFMLIVPCKH